MRADPNDYIIKGVKGEFYPCKPDIFEATYEPVLSGTGEAVEECPTNCGWTAEEWVSCDPEATWKGTVRAPVHHRYKTPFCPDCGRLLKPEDQQ